MQEFLELQTKRRLQSHETIVEYLYSKNVIPNKAPYHLAEEERISLILSGIEDDTWANPLAAQLCGTATELIDRAALLDARRRTTVCAENDKNPSSSTASHVEPSGKFSSSEVPPPKQGTPNRTGETLIATFCRQSDESVSKDEGSYGTIAI
ncbi:hypothetical protein HPB51_015462 [Rhipicephalus microplus]|uniref:Uncharacterized protein n=1 Tax=Rhipicephalus microplus TaxID=6941 RepID=A0A9J6EAF1_RHIMP|nr:hypothetical protein HPB51_015462 [Rhipicephalus microplus]